MCPNIQAARTLTSGVPFVPVVERNDGVGLIESQRLKFILCGSSARKLRRGGVNLLAGRAVTKELFPLVSAELGSHLNLNRALSFGSLPIAVTEEGPEDYLRTYAETYLDQEIRSEALTRNLGSFTRFLEVAARQNGQTTNASSIARDSGVARTTVRDHFDLLVDTLIGYWLLATGYWLLATGYRLPAWKLKSSNKQVRQSKFYLFDCGVARALSGRLPFPPSHEERDPLLETFLLGEMRAYLAYSGLGYPLYYWRNYQGTEVDVLCETVTGFVALEIKASSRWERRFNRGMHKVRDSMGASKTCCIGVYLGERESLVDDVRVYPVQSFLERLWNGEIFA